MTEVNRSLRSATGEDRSNRHRIRTRRSITNSSGEEVVARRRRKHENKQKRGGARPTRSRVDAEEATSRAGNTARVRVPGEAAKAGPMAFLTGFIDRRPNRSQRLKEIPRLSS
ncbi:hypothetical protein Zmor_009644 [Zophobas morio]|uniref:Uncharacterized protein n=1 Tax=Zophobas morio TaxID=2755281 RepID=A0AA38IH64_9CUCU|nr:hypothetical protein Zmor_009644 [Zophobas morio]